MTPDTSGQQKAKGPGVRTEAQTPTRLSQSTWLQCSPAMGQEKWRGT